jgi:hypothetical protein
VPEGEKSPREYSTIARPYFTFTALPPATPAHPPPHPSPRSQMSSGADQLPRTLHLASSPVRDTTVPGEFYRSSSRVVGSHVHLDGRSGSQYVLLPTQDPSQAENSFTDGSDILFSLYNEKAADYDQKLAENWREDAQAIMLLVRNALIHFSPVKTHQHTRVVLWQPQWQHSFHSHTSPRRPAPKTSRRFISARSTNYRPVPDQTGLISHSHRPLQSQFLYPRWYTCFGFRV